MSALSVEVPFPVFYDRDGQPLENGYVWIGQPNLNPQTNPVQVYFDKALTQLAAQPLRTVAGYISNAGTPAQIYIDGVNFSILVQDSKGTMVYNFPEGTGIDPNAAGIDYDPGPDSLLLPGGTISVKSALDQITDEATGSSIIGFEQAGASAVPRSVQDKLREYAVSVKDFGAVGDGVADDRAAINAAFAEVIGRGAGTVYFPAGTYFVSEFIGNTNFSGNTQEVRIAVEGEPGTVINCNPTVFGNVALFLRFVDAKTIIVKNLKVECNTKVAGGIFATSTTFMELVQIENCIVDDCHAVNNAGVTTSVQPINASSGGWGYNASVTNCIVRNVTRAKTGLACQAIVVVGFAAATVSNNYIVNVRHSGQVGDLIDADGIVIFSHQDGSGLYEKSAAVVAGNIIRNCEGRFIKLQTHGSALVEGNFMTLAGSLELIDNFRAVDSQVAQATIINNKIEIGTGWTGANSGTIAQLTNPAAANLRQTNELFVQKFNDNEVYIQKLFTYGVLATPFTANVASKNVLEICNNKMFRDRTLDPTSVDVAVTNFINFNAITPVANVTGQTIWTVANNQVAAFNFIGVGSALTSVDYTNKWWMYIYNNVKYGGNVFLIINIGVSSFNFPYTSNVMVRDNQMGTTPGQTSDLFAAPINSALLINGSDFSTGGSSAGTISPAPANWQLGHFGRKGGVLFAETVASATAFRYISTDNGANWYQV
jgi:hypothetical protein